MITINQENVLTILDNSNSPWYSVFSDRVADTCEARNLGKLLRELSCISGDFMCTTNDKPFLTYSQQIQKLSAKFAVIILLQYLLSQDEFSQFIDDIEHALKVLFNSTRQLQETQMYKYMGFPANWLDIKDAPLSTV